MVMRPGSSHLPNTDPFSRLSLPRRRFGNSVIAMLAFTEGAMRRSLYEDHFSEVIMGDVHDNWQAHCDAREAPPNDDSAVAETSSVVRHGCFGRTIYEYRIDPELRPALLGGMSVFFVPRTDRGLDERDVRVLAVAPLAGSRPLAHRLVEELARKLASE